MRTDHQGEQSAATGIASPTSPASPPSIGAALRRPGPLATLAALLMLVVTTGWQWRDGAPLSTDLTALLPALQQSALETQAQQRVEQRLNDRLLLLVGHPDHQQALALAEAITQQWRECGCFARVTWRRDVAVDAIREQLLSQRLALLDGATREQLLDRPADYLAQRAAALVDPFGAGGLVPPDRDWLGLTRQIPLQRSVGKLEFDATSGAALIPNAERVWILVEAAVRAETLDADAPLAIGAAVAQARTLVQPAGGEILALGGVLYAAAARDQAATEIAWVGGGGVLGIVLLLLFAFRSLRALTALLPVFTGLACGAAACIAWFGEIHVLTLVLGASLIGVAIDYPLHYLSKSWRDLSQNGGERSATPWRSIPALRSTLPGLRLSLATSLVGYGALLFTPFPALTQIAVFSVVGLLGAFLVAVGLLPALLATTILVPNRHLLSGASALEQRRQRLSPRLIGALALLVAALTVVGMARLDINNDVRQWVAPPPALLADARAVADLIGEQPTSQFFIVEGADIDTVITRARSLGDELTTLIARGELTGFRNIEQFVASPREQQALRTALAQLSDQLGPLQALGIGRDQLTAEIAALQALPVVTPAMALAGPLGEPWRDLWLAGSDDSPAAALVTLNGLRTPSALPALADRLPGVRYVDRIAALDRALDAVQWRAMQLKIIATVLLLLLVALVLGRHAALTVVGLPFAAALVAAGMLGLLGQPLTLFGLFGLLLATAVGVDYAILMVEQVGGMAVSLLGVALAAATAWLSFGLLALSQTPAVSNFGLAVTLGLAFSVLFAPWAVVLTGMRKRS